MTSAERVEQIKARLKACPDVGALHATERLRAAMMDFISNAPDDVAWLLDQLAASEAREAEALKRLEALRGGIPVLEGDAAARFAIALCDGCGECEWCVAYPGFIADAKAANAESAAKLRAFFAKTESQR